MLIACDNDEGSFSYNNTMSTQSQDLMSQVETLSNDTSEAADSFLVLKKAGNFSEGVAWITYNDDLGDEYLALINTDGKIIYKEKNGYYSRTLPPEMSSVCIIKDNNGNQKLITKSGKIVANSQSEDFDEILAYGDGLALVYKYSGPKDEKHLYGIIDTTGKFVVEYINFNKKSIGNYEGCGMFSIELYNGTRWALLNGRTGKYIYVGTKYLSSLPEYVDGFAYFTPGYYIFENPSDSLLSAKKMPFCSLDTNFQTSTINEFTRSSNGILIVEENPIYIINPKTNEKYNIGYNNNQMLNLYYDDNFGLITIKASDGNTYFTLIDRKGEEQFDAIKFENYIRYSNGKIIYTINKKITILNTKGEILAQDLVYKNINEFSDDIAVAIDEYNNSCYINSNGKRILQNIHE